MESLSLRLSDGVTLLVPRALESITTYVLLEQETWFEKELKFLHHYLKPGMTAIDIGANLGVYALPMAKLVGPTGRVFAYEPASEPRTLLQRSGELNGAKNLEIVAAAVSDREGEAHLSFGASSELNTLTGSAPGETVRIVNLDAEDATRGWAAPDFIKIDAEGEEERILAGGKNFFVRHSPLVMLEIQAGERVNEALRLELPRMGYGLYRLLPDSPLLVPVAASDALDAYELNLFAAKDDRAAALARAGWLVEGTAEWKPAANTDPLALLKAQPFASSFALLFTDRMPRDRPYQDCLAAYSDWLSPAISPARRWAALDFAFRTLRTLAPTPARLSTLARIALESGNRAAGVEALASLIDTVRLGRVDFTEPFWPALPRYDAIAPGERIGDWFFAAAVEALERNRGHSSTFSGMTPFLEWLCRQPFASNEMERRRTLVLARAGQVPEVPPRLRVEAPDHLNAKIWNARKVPGTKT